MPVLFAAWYALTFSVTFGQVDFALTLLCYWLAKYTQVVERISNPFGGIFSGC